MFRLCCGPGKYLHQRKQQRVWASIGPSITNFSMAPRHSGAVHVNGSTSRLLPYARGADASCWQSGLERTHIDLVHGLTPSGIIVTAHLEWQRPARIFRNEQTVHGATVWDSAQTDGVRRDRQLYFFDFGTLGRRAILAVQVSNECLSFLGGEQFLNGALGIEAEILG